MSHFFTRLIRLHAWKMFAVLVIGLACSDSYAQAIAISTPFTSANDSFYERSGINFGFRLPSGNGNGSRVVGLGPGGQMLPNVTFGQGSFGSAIPQFGGYDPNSSLQTGFGLRFGNGGGIDFGLELGKGSNRTVTNQTPTIVVQNGGFGSVFDGNVRPFVSGVTPVIGGGYGNAAQLDLSQLGQGDSGGRTEDVVAPANESTAMTGDLSVAAIKANRRAATAAKEKEFNDLVAIALAHEEIENYSDARLTFRKAMIKCTDPVLKKKLKAKLAELKGK